MALDPSIPLSFRPPQIEGPVDQHRTLLQLMALQQQQQMGRMKMEEAQQDRAALNQLQGLMAQSGGDPEQAIRALLVSGNPRAIELASKLRGMMPKSAEPFTLSPGARRYGADGKLIAEAPANPDKEFAPPEILRLQTMLDRLPAGHPYRAQIEARIKHLGAPPAGVTVNMPPSSDLMQKPDGTFVRVRIGKDGKVEQIPLGDARPPATAAEAKATAEAAEGEQTISSVRQRIAKMASIIQGGAMAGSPVGPLGMASRVGETVAGAVNQQTATPAIDYKNEQALLLADVRKMVEKDPNLSKDERERLYETLGGGIMQTPGSAIRTLNNVLNYVENKKVTGRSRAATIERRAPAIGAVQGGYRFKGGDPSRQENWERVQ